MHASTAKMISLLAVPLALGVHILPVAAQDASENPVTPGRTAQTDASFRFADVARFKLDKTEDGMQTAPNADNPAFTGTSRILTHIPLRAGGSLKTEALSDLNAGAQNEPVIVERTSPSIQRFVSRPNQGLHSPLLKQSTIGNILIGLSKKYGLESMTQSDNVYWFYDSQKQLAPGNKAQKLLACSKTSRLWSICASANARSFGVYFGKF